jgi:EAL and modified HD-GYP domain-containing signal transduction protein
MCQAIAEKRRAPNADACFTVGLFSTLEAVLDQPFAELLPRLSLTEELNKALEKHEGPIGAVLKACVAYESGDWAEARLDGAGPADLRKCYLESIRWTSEILAQMLGTDAERSPTPKRA